MIVFARMDGDTLRSQAVTGMVIRCRVRNRSSSSRFTRLGSGENVALGAEHMGSATALDAILPLGSGGIYGSINFR